MIFSGCIYLDEHSSRMTFEEAYQFCYNMNVGLDTKYTGLIEIHNEEQFAILDQILGRNLIMQFYDFFYFLL